MYATPSHWKSDVVIVNGIRVHYSRTGGDKPALLLLHGATDNGLCWTRTAKAMESEYDVVMPDARAHGKSEMGSVDDLSFETMADDTAMLIRELKLDRPIVVGHSMGGQMATILAGKHPDLVSKIVLEDPAYGLKKAGLRSKIMILVMMFMIHRNKKKNEAQIRKLLKRFAPNWSDEEA
ncbi:MAG: alpha/beta hydrolase, partial [Proteobacteria bacterium]|nr:alpha/beta hydrolase [Pseudomonadota bacterium]